jgi:hypothetical protein
MPLAREGIRQAAAQKAMDDRRCAIGLRRNHAELEQHVLELDPISNRLSCKHFIQVAHIDRLVHPNDGVDAEALRGREHLLDKRLIRNRSVCGTEGADSVARLVGSGRQLRGKLGFLILVELADGGNNLFNVHGIKSFLRKVDGKWLEVRGSRIDVIGKPNELRLVSRSADRLVVIAEADSD